MKNNNNCFCNKIYINFMLKIYLINFRIKNGFIKQNIYKMNEMGIENCKIRDHQNYSKLLL